MLKRSIAIAGAAALFLTTTADINLAQRQQPQVRQTAKAVPTVGTTTMTPEAESALVKESCSGCHNQRIKSGSLDLTAVDFAHLDKHAEVAEKMIRKVRAGMMPPPGAPRPAAKNLSQFADSLETEMDRRPALLLIPGRRAFQRLNRAEYGNSIHELLDLDGDAAALLPPDSFGRGFDNIADALTLSPALMEGYVRAASKISRSAIGDLHAAATVATFTLPRTASQMRHVDGTPFGTRGGHSVVDTFPADGEYTFRIEPFDDSNGLLVGSKNATEGEQVEVSINGERVALLDIDPKMTVSSGGVFVQTGPIRVQAGPQRVAAAFIERYS